MNFKFLFVILSVIKTFAEISAEVYTPETDAYVLSALQPLLNPLLGELIFDGPHSISNAPTRPSKNKLPTLKQMKYYMNYAAATHFAYNHKNLDCEYCLRFKKDIADHKGTYLYASNLTVFEQSTYQILIFGL